MNELVDLNLVRDGRREVSFSALLTPARYRACLVARSSLGAFGLRACNPDISLSIDTLGDLDSAVRVFASRRSGWNLAMIALDDFSDHSSGIDHLRRLRTRCPNLPVILLSRAFRRDDFGQERLAIGDVSLVCPVGEETLGQAIEIAVDNNLAWRKRRRSLLLEKARLIN